MNTMISYDEPKYGRYRFYKYDYKAGKALPNQVAVKVIGEKGEKYKVVLLGYTDKNVPNQEIWVMKKSVILN